MDVTVSNFGEVKHLILTKLLPSVRYITYDLQFTGLRYEKFQRDHINFLPFQKYKKIKYVAETYQILQLGLSLVVFDKDSSKIKVYPFNFYLFPRNPVGFDKNLTLQLSCVKFNAENGMDWNKWIREGINYVKLSQIQNIQDQQRSKSYRDLIDSLPADLQSYAEDFIRNLKKASQANQNKEIIIPLPRYQSYQKVFTQIFYKYIEEHKLSLALKEHEEKLIITKIPQSERDKIIEKHQEQTFGFALLFQHIWKKRIPFVGHNCNLDLMYIFHNFIAPLPDSYFEFKRTLRESGNSFYDTKYISAKYPEFAQSGSRLQDLMKFFRSVGEKIFEKKLTSMMLDPPFDRYSLDKQALHQAGYDSYITAWVFQQMMKMKEDVDKKCIDRLNLLNSFFYIDLSRDQDQINQYYAQNILRVNIPYDEREKEDLRTKRAEEVKNIKRGLEELKDSFAIYEGYRQIFIQIKKDRKYLMKRIFQMVEKKQIKEINSFASYLSWQKERANREYKRLEEYKNNKNRAFEKKQRMEEESSSNSQQSSRRRIRKRQN